MKSSFTNYFGFFKSGLQKKNAKGLSLKAFYLLLIMISGMNGVKGQTLLTDDFTGTVGTALTANGWTLHSGTATPFLISSPGLTYTSYTGSGVGNAASTGGTSDDINKAFASTTTGSLYMSFMYKPTSASLTTDYSVMFGNASGASVTGFYGKFFVQRDASNNLRFGITKNAAASISYTGYTYALNTTYLIVIRYDLVAGAANDIAYLFVNPVLGTTEPTPTLTGLADAVADPAQLISVCLRQSTSSAGAVYDGFKVGKTWADITAAYYPRTSATDLSLVSNWTDDVTGVAGTSPVDFTSPNQLFNISRNPTVLNPLTISGVSSGITLTTTPLEFGPLSRLTIGTGSTVDFNNNSVILRSTTTGTASIGTITGILNGATNVTMERFIKLRAGGVGRAYRLLAPTVNTSGSIKANWMNNENNTTAGTNINSNAPGYGTQITGAAGSPNFDVTTSNQPSLFAITNGVAPAYPAITSTTGTLSATTGYFLYVRGDRSMDMTLPLNPATNPTSSTTLRTTGTLLTGTKTQADFAAMDATNLALNLVTNPYPSAIDWSLVRGDAGTTNLSTSYTVWDANLSSRGGFATVTTGGVASGGSGANQFIQPGQAFFVQTSGGTPTIAIKETHKVANNNNTVFLVPPQTFGVALYYTESTGYRRQADGVIAMYDNKYSAAMDADDAAEINNWDENIAIARDGKHLAIEARPVIVTSDDLPLFMNNMKKQAYEFEFTPASITNTNLKAELIDNYLGTRTLLSVTSPTVVSFTVTANAASAAADRFKVAFGAFGSPTGVDAITIKASQQNGGVQVDWTSKTETDMANYEVEKSTYGTSFGKVNTTTALGNSANPVNYNWFDANPNMGTNFYRIKATDKAGNVRYSDIVRVLFGKGEPRIVLYPNPMEGNTFKVDMYNLVKGTYMLDLYNNSGQKIYTEQLQHDGSQATKTINIKGEVGKGTYQLQLSNDNGFKTTQKIIKN